MARASFGGGVADFVVAANAPGDPIRFAAATLTMWSAETGGTQITDLMLGGDAITQISVGTDGQIPTFQGPDEVLVMWASANGGARVMIDASGDIALRAGDAADRAETAAGEAAAFGGTNNTQVAGFLGTAGPSKTVLDASYALKAPAWVTGHVYSTVGEMVTHSGLVYEVVTPHTAGAFDASKFSAIGSPPPADASTTAKGIVELATNAETTTGTDAVRATTPAGVKAALVPVRAAINPLGVYKPAGWGAAWQAARAASGSGLARVAVVGDSIMRGFFTSNLDTKGYIGLLRAALQTQYGDGGSGFKGAGDTTIISPAAYSAINYLTLGGTGPWVQNTGFRKNGPGGIVLQPGSLNDYVEGTVRGTIVEIFVIDASPFKNFKYSIDGGALVTVNSSATNGIMHVTVTGLSAGTHTVRVTSYQGATYYVGISGRNTTGVVVDNYAVQGTKALHWNGLDNTEATTNVIQGGAGAWSGGTKRPADLILYGSILNDSASSNDGVYLTDLKKFLDGVRGPTHGTPPPTNGPMYGQQDIAILLPHAGMFDNLTTQYYNRIAREARNLAELYGAAVVNWWTIGHNSWDWMNQQSYWSDGTSASGAAGTDKGHPNDAGMQWMYDTLVAALPEILG